MFLELKGQRGITVRGEMKAQVAALDISPFLRSCLILTSSSIQEVNQRERSVRRGVERVLAKELTSRSHKLLAPVAY